MNMNRSVLAATVSFLLCGVSACGGEERTPPPVTAPSTVLSPQDDLDTPRPSDAEFFRRFRTTAGWLPEPQGLAEGVRESTLVLTARVTGVRKTRVLGTGGNAHGFVGVTLEPVEILHGAKAEGLDEITVEFDDPAPADTSAFLADLRDSLPRGQSLWFLLWKGTLPESAPKNAHVNPDEKSYYRLTHPFGGLALQSASGIITPLAERAFPPGRESLARDVQKAGRLSALVQAVKAR